MELHWMGEYRELMEKLIKYGNAYAQNYSREMSLGTDVRFSPAQLQALEYILENEDRNQNMAQIAGRLGMSPSAFSKNVSKMVSKGLLEKYHTASNRKDVIIRASPTGRRVYEQYVQSVAPVFQSLTGLWKRLPPEALTVFMDSLDLLSRYNQALSHKSDDPPALIRIE